MALKKTDIVFLSFLFGLSAIFLLAANSYNPANYFNAQLNIEKTIRNLQLINEGISEVRDGSIENIAEVEKISEELKTTFGKYDRDLQKIGSYSLLSPGALIGRGREYNKNLKLINQLVRDYSKLYYKDLNNIEEFTKYISNIKYSLISFTKLKQQLSKDITNDKSLKSYQANALKVDSDLKLYISGFNNLLPDLEKGLSNLKDLIPDLPISKQNKLVNFIEDAENIVADYDAINSITKELMVISNTEFTDQLVESYGKIQAIEKKESSIYYLFSAVLFLMALGYLLFTNTKLQKKVKRSSLEVRKSKKEKEMIMESVPTLVCYLDSEERYKLVNKNYADFVERPVQEIIGQRIYDIVGEDNYESIRSHIQNTLAGSEELFESERTMKDGSVKKLRARYVPDLNSSGNARGFFASLEDITDLKTAESKLHKEEKQLKEKNQQLMEAKNKADKIKGEFIANISEEISNPMSTIVGFISLLQQTKLDDEQSKYVGAINRSAESMQELVSDVLDVTQIESGEIELEENSFNIRTLIKDLTNILHIGDKDVELSIRVANDIPQYLIGDSGRLRQILMNLGSNAVKYTEKGSVTFNVESKGGKENQELYFEVVDSGMGIAEDRVENIFNKFSHINTNFTREFGGTGLGLAICKKLVEMMGGKIGVKSELGKGSTFWFSIDFKVDSNADTSKATDFDLKLLDSSESIEVDFSTKFKANILLAEDNPVTQDISQTMLEAIGCNVTIAHNGMEAVMGWRKGDCDLILMDCQMPVLDGYGATSEIRDEEKDGSRVPIVGLTSNVMSGNREKCIEAGMDDTISKPLKEENLIKVLMKLLPEDKKYKETVVSEEAQTVSPFLSDEPEETTIGELAEQLTKSTGKTAKELSDADYRAIDHVILTKLKELLPDSFSDILGRFIEDSDAALEEISESLKTNDITKLREAVRKLKSPSAQVGANSLYSLSKQLEKIAKTNSFDGVDEILEQMKSERDSVCEELKKVS